MIRSVKRGEKNSHGDDPMARFELIFGIGFSVVYEKGSLVSGLVSEPDSIGLVRRGVIERVGRVKDAFHEFLRFAFRAVTDENAELADRIFLISQKSVRARLTTYFALMAAKYGPVIDIGRNHCALAEYLCLNRSALSRELSKMRSEGLIDYKKNIYVLKSFKSSESRGNRSV
jgi:hypothetical protein